MSAPVILVVESKSELAALFSVALEQRGYRVVVTTKRSTAGDLLMAAQPDLVMAEALVGGGQELEMQAYSSNVPLLLISGHPDMIVRLEGGAIPFLAMPFRLSRMVSEIDRLLAISGAGLGEHSRRFREQFEPGTDEAKRSAREQRQQEPRFFLSEPEDMTAARIKRWRAKAEELRSVADQARTPSARDNFRRAAASYDSLAYRAEEGLVRRTLPPAKHID